MSSDLSMGRQDRRTWKVTTGDFMTRDTGSKSRLMLAIGSSGRYGMACNRQQTDDMRQLALRLTCARAIAHISHEATYLHMQLPMVQAVCGGVCHPLGHHDGNQHRQQHPHIV